MNSRSGKPFETLDNSPHGTQTENENAIEPRRQEDNPAQSPYAPKLKRRDSQSASPPQPAARGTESAEGSPAADVERLEASLRWLKQQSGELCGAYTNVPLPEWPDRKIGVNSELNIRTARSLEPEILIAPALLRAQGGNMESALASRRVPLLILIAGLLVAAPIAYFTADKSSSAPEKVREA